MRRQLEHSSHHRAGPFPARWWSRIDADRLGAIGSFVASLDTDVVALQDVARVNSDGDLVDNLARQLGMEAGYGAVRTFPVTDGGAVTGAGCLGNALLARLPIARSRTVALPMAPPTPSSCRPAPTIRRPACANPMARPRP